MRLLGLETAGPTASVAILFDGLVKAEYCLNNTKTHSETILPMAERLLSDLSLGPKDIDGICVDVGPGSFTGVRIGVCAANAMGLALKIPVIGVDAPRVLYQTFVPFLVPVAVLIDARQENLYASLFQDGDCTIGPVATTLSKFLTEIPPNTLFLGDGAMAYREKISAACASPLFAPEWMAQGRASALLYAGADKIAAAGGLNDMPREAEPLYLRPSQAERMWEIRHGNR